MQAGYRYTIAGSQMPPLLLSSGNMTDDWSSSGEHRQFTKELVVLPYYNFTAPHWDQHPPEKVADCTHYCPSPFLYLPLWRSFRIALDRQFGGAVADEAPV